MAEAIFETVILAAPLTVAGAEIGAIRVRKPSPGEMRGVRLAMLMAMDVDAISAVLPRVTEPALSEATVSEMDLTDFTSLGAALVGFLTGRGGALTM